MIIGCEDICGHVIDRLRKLGYDLESHPLHTDILKILEKEITFVKK